MSNYNVYTGSGRASVVIFGEGLTDAIMSNLGVLAPGMGIDMAEGVSVTMEYRGDILDGKGGVKVDVLHGKVTTTFWVNAKKEDLPLKQTINY